MRLSENITIKTQTAYYHTVENNKINFVFLSDSNDKKQKK